MSVVVRYTTELFHDVFFGEVPQFKRDTIRFPGELGRVINRHHLHARPTALEVDFGQLNLMGSGDSPTIRDFKAYCKRESTSENYMFLEEVGDFFRDRQYTTSRLRFLKRKGLVRTHISVDTEKARELVRRYISADAVSQLNLSQSTRERILQKSQLTEGIPLDIFEEAVAEVKQLLREGPWPRFLNKQRRAN
jgi:hypothetical protein